MNCKVCIDRNDRLLNCCFDNNFSEGINVLTEYKILLMKICKKYNDIYCYVSSFLCHNCITCNVYDHTFYLCCVNSPKLAKYILDTNNITYKKTICYQYQSKSHTKLTPLQISLLTNFNIAYDIIYSNFYDESMMNIRYSYDDWTPLQIICRKHSWFLSKLITTRKITEISITNELLCDCMYHNIKLVIFFLSFDECSQIVQKIIKNICIGEEMNFLSIYPKYSHQYAYYDIERLLKMNLITIELINSIFISRYTFLHFLVRHTITYVEHNDCCNCSNCNCDNYVNKILIVLHESNKLTKEFLSIRCINGFTILMMCCKFGHIRSLKTILSFDECDEEILSLRDGNDKNTLMIALTSYNYKMKYLVLNSKKITKNILKQHYGQNKTIYDMLEPLFDTYFHFKLNIIYYFYKNGIS